ncbi:copper resistance protein B [Bermanella sp. R86510]|uniref:copper resistance protein B n=1 Tax=unclassified Bermanella TaxID=2627862 RepID=UPI0037CA5942
MKITQHITFAITLSTVISAPMASAQEHDMHSGHDMSGMQSANKEMDHSGHDMSPMQSSNKEMDHSNMTGMDHGSMTGSMQPQGGDAPINARDPHAYSSGFTLSQGPYSQAGPRQLKLADEHSFWAVLGDRLEYDPDSESTVFDLQSWYGTTFHRLVIKAEGDIADGSLEEMQADVLYSQALDGYFDTQLGVRLDQNEEGTDRQWLAVSLQGLAPYWFEVDISAYLGEDARTALAMEAEYELLFTQRLVLQSRAELSAYGKEDLDNGIGAGLTNGEIGMRLRYEVSRQFAPYLGIEWRRSFADTADLIRKTSGTVEDTEFVVGLKFWF